MLAKNNHFKMSTSLKNNESLEQINLARWSKQNMKPDFHLMGYIVVKLRKKPLLVGFLQTHASTVFSVILILSSRKCKVFVDFSIVNFILSSWLFKIFKKDEHEFTSSKTANTSSTYIQQSDALVSQIPLSNGG